MRMTALRLDIASRCGCASRDPDVPDAAGPVELGVRLARVGGQRLGDRDAVGDGAVREVEIHGMLSRGIEP